MATTGLATDGVTDRLRGVLPHASLSLKSAVVLTTLIVGWLIVAGPSAADVAKPQPRVRTVELHLRDDGTVALKLRVRHHHPGSGPQVFAFRPLEGKVVGARPTPRARLWRIGPNTGGAGILLNQLQHRVADGGTPALIAGVKDGVPKRFEIPGYDLRVRGVRAR